MRYSRFFLLVIIVSLASCNSGNKVVSSFGKRKYTKGYFFNRPGELQTTIAKITNKPIIKLHQKQINIDNKLVASPVVKQVPLNIAFNERNKNSYSIKETKILPDAIDHSIPAMNEQSQENTQIHNNGRPSLILAIVVAIAAAVGFATAAHTITVVGTIALIVFLIALVGSMIFAIPTFFTKDAHPVEGLIAAIVDIIAIGLLLVGNLFNE